MPSRRAHTKSRLGCVQCKARRVKCDQTYPTCKNCIRHEKTCVYSHVNPNASSPASNATTGEAQNHGTARAIAMPPGGPTFDSLDLKLMHHYCTSTAATISFSPKAQDVWRDVIPKYAYTHHMLMHAILTLSANHYVNVHKSSLDAVTLHEYRTRALYHHQLGLQLFRQQVQTPGEDQSNEIALVFAAVLGMLTFADAGTEQGPTSFDDGVKLLSVLRGKQALWRSGRGLSESSIFAPAFFDPPPPERRTDYSSTALALGRLYDSTQDEVCKGTITVLKGVAERQPNSEYRTLGTWPASGSEDFLHLLQSRDEVALQIFEHYCTILESKSELWWVGDFGQKLRVAIRNERWLGGTPNAAKRVSES